MVKVVTKRFWSLLLRRRMFAMGNAIAIGLRKGLMDAKVPVVYEAELTGLALENGRVVGVEVTHGGQTRTVRARRGVVLGSGGFERNLELREKYQPHPTSIDWTTGSQFNTGGGLLGGHRRRRRDRPARRLVVGPDDPAARTARGSAWPSATCPARSSSTRPASDT